MTSPWPGFSAATHCPVPPGMPNPAVTGWQYPHGFWLGASEYPAGRGQPQEAERGWTCGCGRGYNPRVMQCYHCGPAKPEPDECGACSRGEPG